MPNQDPNSTGNQFIFNLRYAGMYSDIETGTFYNYFRDYDPATNRYPESDPLGLAGGQFSTYAYASGNALKYSDPRGLQVLPMMPAAGAAVGGAAEGGAILNPYSASFGVGVAIGTVYYYTHYDAIQNAMDDIFGPPGPAGPTQMAAPGNQADTGIAQRVAGIQSAEVMKGNKRPDRCDVLQKLIEKGEISALAAKATQKAWGCRPSRQSKDKCEK